MSREHSGRAWRHLVFVFLACLLGFHGTDTLVAQGEPSPQDKLQIGVRESPPFSQKVEGQWTGVAVELWEGMARELEWNFDYVETTELNDLLGRVERAELDLAIGALTVTPSREERFDFTQSFLSSGLGIAVVLEESNPILGVVGKLFSLQFLQAFLALAVVLLICGALTWIFERKDNAEEFGGKGLRGLGAGFWWAAVTMTTVGYGDKSPKTLAGRVIGFVWMFASIILISTYTAAIAASLTLERLGAVQGIDDLPGVKVVSVEGSSSAEWLTTQGIGFAKSDSLDSALSALAKGEVQAVVYDAPILKYHIKRDHANALEVLAEVVKSERYAFAMPQGSRLAEPLDQKLVELTERNDWRDLLQRYLGKNR